MVQDLHFFIWISPQPYINTRKVIPFQVSGMGRDGLMPTSTHSLLDVDANFKYACDLSGPARLDLRTAAWNAETDVPFQMGSV